MRAICRLVLSLGGGGGLVRRDVCCRTKTRTTWNQPAGEPTTTMRTTTNTTACNKYIFPIFYVSKRGVTHTKRNCCAFTLASTRAEKVRIYRVGQCQGEPGRLLRGKPQVVPYVHMGKQFDSKILLSSFSAHGQAQASVYVCLNTGDVCV